MAEAHIVAHAGCCLTPQSLRLLNHALVCQEGVAFDNAYQTDSLAVTANDLGLSVIVAAGSAFIAGVNYAGEGMYFVSNDGPVSLQLNPADPADPRCDLVVAIVDGNATDCADAWVLTTITGVPAPVPACPAVPGGALVLATVEVPAGATAVLPANIDDLREPYQSCQVTPACRVGRASNMGVDNNVLETIPFTSEIFDSSNMHENSANTRITFNVPGFYTVGVSVEFSAANDYTRINLAIVLNGSIRISYTSETTQALSVPPRAAANTMYEFAAGDYIEAQVLQTNDAAVARTLLMVPQYSPHFYAARIGG